MTSDQVKPFIFKMFCEFFVFSRRLMVVHKEKVVSLSLIILSDKVSLFIEIQLQSLHGMPPLRSFQHPALIRLQLFPHFFFSSVHLFIVCRHRNFAILVTRTHKRRQISDTFSLFLVGLSTTFSQNVSAIWCNLSVFWLSVSLTYRNRDLMVHRIKKYGK